MILGTLKLVPKGVSKNEEEIIDDMILRNCKSEEGNERTLQDVINSTVENLAKREYVRGIKI